MAKLILKYESAVLKEIPLFKSNLTIGRTPGNDVVIDNLAVSGNHARLIVEQDHFFVEDMNSLNGTFLNKQRVRKSMLRDGDEILIGKHSLVFWDGGSYPDAASTMDRDQQAKLIAEQTVILDTKQRRDFLAKATVIASEGSSPTAHHKVGCLTVLSGKTNQPEYILTGKMTVVGKSDMATVKLRGWFAPKVAAIINRKEGIYTISPSERVGATTVNAETLTASRNLEEGDTVKIGRVSMQFFYRE